MPFAALDLGTNTFRLLIAGRRRGRPPWQRLEHAQAVVRLGEGLAARGRLDPAARARALEALGGFAARLTARGVAPGDAFAVATAAVREAADGAAFLEEARARTGIAIRTIPGEEEARLSLAGAHAALAPPITRDWMLVDIGGGSTEFVRARGARIVAATSVPVGVVKLTERFVFSSPPPPEAVDALRRSLRPVLEEAAAALGAGAPPGALVATAGTPTTLAALALGLATYDPDRVNGFRFTARSWAETFARVLRTPARELAAHPLVPPRRADVLPAGAVLLDEVRRRWGGEGFYVSDAGLLEGAWLVAAGLASPPSTSTGRRS